MIELGSEMGSPGSVFVRGLTTFDAQDKGAELLDPSIGDRASNRCCDDSEYGLSPSHRSKNSRKATPSLRLARSPAES